MRRTGRILDSMVWMSDLLLNDVLLGRRRLVSRSRYSAPTPNGCWIARYERIWRQGGADQSQEGRATLGHYRSQIKMIVMEQIRYSTRPEYYVSNHVRRLDMTVRTRYVQNIASIPFAIIDLSTRCSGISSCESASDATRPNVLTFSDQDRHSTISTASTSAPFSQRKPLVPP